MARGDIISEWNGYIQKTSRELSVPEFFRCIRCIDSDYSQDKNFGVLSKQFIPCFMTGLNIVLCIFVLPILCFNHSSKFDVTIVFWAGSIGSFCFFVYKLFDLYTRFYFSYQKDFKDSLKTDFVVPLVVFFFLVWESFVRYIMSLVQ